MILKHLLWLYSSNETLAQEIFDLEKRAGILVSSAGRLELALQQLRRTNVDVLLVSLPYEDWEPEALLREFAAVSPSLPVVMYEPHGRVATAMRLTRMGALHYIGEPADSDKLIEMIHLAFKKNPQGDLLSQSSSAAWRRLLVGESRAMQEVVETIALVGGRRSTVLISGETGTGKEMAARAIHMASPRAHLPMVAVNCAALPENLLEAELFGHTKGAFTGAVNSRIGLFEQAHRSTILLDEIADMPLPLQTKLLRVLQEREIQRIGSSETIRVDVRVIAASNTDLEVAVAQKRLREDLFYRLNVVPLNMPALRDRKSDIPELLDHFIRKFSDLEGMPEKCVADEAMDYLMNYRWPGNVRQLEHAVESALALSGSRRVLHRSDFRLPQGQPAPELGLLGGLDVPESGIDLEQLMTSIERTLLERALLRSGGNKARAADLLNLKRTTLVSKFKALQTCA